MKATVLIDNIAKDDLVSEWGLSLYIEYKDKKILLDIGASSKFLQNARKMNIHLEDVDFGVLSHAHFDHANGMRGFFSINEKAAFYLQENSKENCYHKVKFFKAYIGIKRGTLSRYAHRVVYATGDYAIAEGIYLIPHKTPGLSKVGEKNHMYVKRCGRWYPDDFSHEQSLVFDTEKGLVIFNSCSHGGADVIINEVAATFPDKQVYALIGGFHLHRLPEADVRSLAGRIRETGIEKIYTGHCTGQSAFSVLKEELGDKAEQLSCGLVMEF